MLLKRMNSSNMNRDKGTKRLVLSKEMLQSRMSLLEEEGADDVLKLVNSTEVPDWMLPILKKLPDEGVVELPRVKRISGGLAYRFVKRTFDICSCSAAFVLKSCRLLRI